MHRILSLLTLNAHRHFRHFAVVVQQHEIQSAWRWFSVQHTLVWRWHSNRRRQRNWCIDIRSHHRRGENQQKSKGKNNWTKDNRITGHCQSHYRYVGLSWAYHQMGNWLRSFGSGNDQSNSHLQWKVHKYAVVNHRRTFWCENTDFGSKVSHQYPEQSTNLYDFFDFSFMCRLREQTFPSVGQCCIVNFYVWRSIAFDTKIFWFERPVERPQREVYFTGSAFDCHSWLQRWKLYVLSDSENLFHLFLSDKILFRQPSTYSIWCRAQRDKPNRLCIRRKR